VFGNLELGITTLAIVALLVGIRAVLWELGVAGLAATAVSSGIIAGGVFVMGLVVAGTLSDYRDAERAPTDLASGLYSIPRESEAMHAVWSVPDPERGVADRRGRPSGEAVRWPGEGAHPPGGRLGSCKARAGGWPWRSSAPSQSPRWCPRSERAARRRR
jgi:hypothetical protein